MELDKGGEKFAYSDPASNMSAKPAELLYVHLHELCLCALVIQLHTALPSIFNSNTSCLT